MMQSTLVLRRVGNTSRLDNECHTPIRSLVPATSGRAATHAPLNAPTDVPTIMSGVTPASNKLRSIPACTAPRLPPPESTNAVTMIVRLWTSGEAHVDVLSILQVSGRAVSKSAVTQGILLDGAEGRNRVLQAHALLKGDPDVSLTLGDRLRTF